MESVFTVSDVLGQLKRWEAIKVNDICSACRNSYVSRRELEDRLVASGYVYAIAYDAFMPPDWVEAMRGRGTWRESC